MGENWVVVMPRDAYAVPDQLTQRRLEHLLRTELAGAEEFTVATSQNPVFEHPGENWNGVRCPNCATEIDDDWFDGRVSFGPEGMDDLDTVTPCCGAPTTFNDLDFVSAAGFGRFRIEARDPDWDWDDRRLLATVEEAMGAPARVIFVHP